MRGPVVSAIRSCKRGAVGWGFEIGAFCRRLVCGNSRLTVSTMCMTIAQTSLFHGRGALETARTFGAIVTNGAFGL